MFMAFYGYGDEGATWCEFADLLRFGRGSKSRRLRARSAVAGAREQHDRDLAVDVSCRHSFK